MTGICHMSVWTKLNRRFELKKRNNAVKWTARRFQRGKPSRMESGAGASDNRRGYGNVIAAREKKVLSRQC